MFAEGLPERYKISDVIDLYCKNFEKTLILQGGKIEDGKYSPYDKNQLAVLTTYADKYVAE